MGLGIKLVDATGNGVDAYEADAMPGCIVEHFAIPGTGCDSWAQTLVRGGGFVGRPSSLLYLVHGGSGSTGSASCRAAPKALDSVTFDMKSVVATAAGDSTFVGFIASNGSAYGLELLLRHDGPVDRRAAGDEERHDRDGGQDVQAGGRGCAGQGTSGMVVANGRQSTPGVARCHERLPPRRPRRPAIGCPP